MPHPAAHCCIPVAPDETQCSILCHQLFIYTCVPSRLPSTVYAVCIRYFLIPLAIHCILITHYFLRPQHHRTQPSIADTCTVPPSYSPYTLQRCIQHPYHNCYPPRTANTPCATQPLAAEGNPNPVTAAAAAALLYCMLRSLAPLGSVSGDE